MHTEGGLQIEPSAPPPLAARPPVKGPPAAKGPCLPFSCPARAPWRRLDPGLLQWLLEEKERALAVLQETVKVQAYQHAVRRGAARQGPGRQGAREHIPEIARSRGETDHPASPVITPGTTSQGLQTHRPCHPDILDGRLEGPGAQAGSRRQLPKTQAWFWGRVPVPPVAEGLQHSRVQEMLGSRHCHSAAPTCSVGRPGCMFGPESAGVGRAGRTASGLEELEKW